jgi:UDP-N-acetylenolpyruvoylglucosamine reductase
MLNRLRGLHLEHDTGSPMVSCGAGVFFAKAAHYRESGLQRHGMGIAIPGTVGGAW